MPLARFPLLAAVDIKQEESKMVRSRLVASLLVIAMLCAMAGTSLAATTKPKCAFDGYYSFFFWDPDTALSGVGYFQVNCAWRGAARRNHQLQR